MGDFAAGAGYLNTASIGIPPASALVELAALTDDWAHGRTQAPEYDAWVDRSRVAWARLRGVDPESVAIGPQVSYFMGIVARALPAGAEVVGYEGDFTSVLWPFLARGDLHVRLVPHGALADEIAPSTAAVAFSAVQSADGRIAAFDDIAAAAREHDVLTAVDATQAGWLPFDAARFDVVVEGAYKWLVSPRGTCLMYVRPELVERLPVTAPGWYSAETVWSETIYGPRLELAEGVRRFDMSPAWLAWVGTAPALEYLADRGLESSHAHDIALSDRACEGLGREPSGSAIVSIDADGAEAKLAAAGISSAIRAGGVRVSFHVYNDDDDVERLLAALR
jgi:selenocysteine lyase/cysteine desulfurase